MDYKSIDIVGGGFEVAKDIITSLHMRDKRQAYENLIKKQFRYEYGFSVEEEEAENQSDWHYGITVDLIEDYVASDLLKDILDIASLEYIKRHISNANIHASYTSYNDTYILDLCYVFDKDTFDECEVLMKIELDSVFAIEVTSMTFNAESNNKNITMILIKYT